MIEQNIWIMTEMRTDGYEYYEMLLVYFDDIMKMSHLGDQVSKKLPTFTISREGINISLHGTYGHTYRIYRLRMGMRYVQIHQGPIHY